MQISPGSPSPLGATPVPFPSSTPPNLTINFALHTPQPHVTLLLFPASAHAVIREPSHQIPLTHRTASVHHICLTNLPADLAYAYHLPSARYRLLADPYAKWLESPASASWMTLEGESFAPPDSTPAPRVKRVRSYVASFPTLRKLGVEEPPLRLCRFTAPHKARLFDWGGERAPRTPHEELVIYEAHVRALTPEGTLGAAVRVIPYLKWLGVTALQLMPVFEFSEMELGAFHGDFGELHREVGKRKGNHWGYSPMSWFSVMNRYAGQGGGAWELKVLVKALHEEGIECFLDVVYNHSANASCPLHFLDVQEDYYMGEGHGSTFAHSNISGCGNTLSPNSPMMLDMVMQSLRWFVTEYRIDGFRLDAAGVLCRDRRETPISKPPLIEHICADPLLKDTKFIVEGWDAGDQVSSPNILLGEGKGFPRGERFCEWNAEWRDCVRRFVRGDSASARPFCKAMRGCPALFGKENSVDASRPWGANHGINYVACHDGFSLADLVSFGKRTNKDGYDEVSFNCGAEGETEDATVNALRAQQVRNLIFALVISRGVPMIAQGDEFGFSKRGNSNTWNDPQLFAARLPAEPQWYNNTEGLVHFVKRMFDFRRELPQLKGCDFFSSIKWVDEMGKERGRRRSGEGKLSRAKLVAFCATAMEAEDSIIYIAFNNGSTNILAQLPQPEGAWRSWWKVVDTGTSGRLAVCSEDLTGAQQVNVRAHSSVLVRGRDGVR